MRFEGVDDRTAAEALRGRRRDRRAARRRAGRRDLGARADRRRGARPRRHALGRVDRGRGEPRARPARARRGALDPDGVRRRRTSRAWSSSTCPTACWTSDACASTCSRSSPSTSTAPLARLARRRARETTALLDVRVHDPRDVHDRPAPQRRRRAVRRRRGHGDDAGAAVRRGRGGRNRRGRCCCCRRAGGASTRRCARELAAGDGLLVDLRPLRRRRPAGRRHCCDGELSVGDYVLAGGEAAALVVIEAVTRLVPGVIGNEASAVEESFTDRSARVPAVHPARRVPGVGRARGAAVGRPRRGSPGGAGPRRCAAPWRAGPTCSTGPLARRGGARCSTSSRDGRPAAPLASPVRVSHPGAPRHEPH